MIHLTDKARPFHLSNPRQNYSLFDSVKIVGKWTIRAADLRNEIPVYFHFCLHYVRLVSTSWFCKWINFWSTTNSLELFMSHLRSNRRPTELTKVPTLHGCCLGLENVPMLTVRSIFSINYLPWVLRPSIRISGPSVLAAKALNLYSNSMLDWTPKKKGQDAFGHRPEFTVQTSRLDCEFRSMAWI